MGDPNAPGPDYLDADLDEDIDDDFLYHLYQGGDLLRANRVVEAKDHLEKAFGLKPANPRGQNLLGLVYFKLGLFRRAADIYQKLIDRFPEDPTLRVNLAMVHLKADQLDDAEAGLLHAIDLSPDHRSAHRYLGLVLVRKGDTEVARDHFVKAGVKHIDRLIAEDGGDELSHQRQQAIEQAQNKALAEVADEGFKELEDKEIPFREVGPGNKSAAEDGPMKTEHGLESESWQTRESGKSEESQSAEDSDDSSGAAFTEEGDNILVRCDGFTYCRLGTVHWVEGDLKFSAVFKRFGGQETRHPFDRGDRAMALVEGTGVLRLRPPPEMQYLVLQHGGEPGYYAEERVIAFTDTPAWENGRLPSGNGSDLSIFHLFGQTSLIVSVPSSLIARQLSGQRRVCMPIERLVGWSGSLVPRLFEAEPPLPGQLWIELTGKGEILTLA
jgi:hypothetical protein